LLDRILDRIALAIVSGFYHLWRHHPHRKVSDVVGADQASGIWEWR